VLRPNQKYHPATAAAMAMTKIAMIHQRLRFFTIAVVTAPTSGARVSCAAA
jgi:hypothetical protein